MASAPIVGTLDALALRFLPKTYVQENRGAVRTMLYAPLLEFGPGRSGAPAAVDGARVSYMVASAAFRLRTHGAQEDADALEELSARLRSAHFPRLLPANEADDVLFLLLSLAREPVPRSEESLVRGVGRALQNRRAAGTPDDDKPREFSVSACVDDEMGSTGLPGASYPSPIGLGSRKTGKSRMIRGVQPLPHLPEPEDELATPPLMFDSRSSKLQDFGLELASPRLESLSQTKEKALTEKRLPGLTERNDDAQSTTESRSKTSDRPAHPRWEELLSNFHLASDLPGAPESPVYISDAPSEAFDALYRLHTKSSEGPNPFVISEQTVIQATINVLLGVVSPLFAWNETKYCYEPHCQVRTPTTTPASLSSMLEEFSQAGSWVKRLDTHSDTLLKSTMLGRVSQAFAQAILSFLRHFRSSVLSIQEPVRQRRREELDDECWSSWLDDELSPVPSAPHSEPSSTDLSLLELYSHSRSLRDQLATVATLCQCTREEWTPKDVDNFPSGGTLLEHLFTSSAALIGPSERLVSSILQKSLHPYLDILNIWLSEGACEDPFQDFFIIHAWRNRPDEGHRHPDFWDSSFQLERSRLPNFLQGVAAEILSCGKALRILMLQNRPPLKSRPPLSKEPAASKAKSRDSKHFNRHQASVESVKLGRPRHPVSLKTDMPSKLEAVQEEKATFQVQQSQPLPVRTHQTSVQASISVEEEQKKHDPAIVELVKSQIISEYSEKINKLEMRARKARWRKNRIEHKPRLKELLHREHEVLKAELQGELRQAEQAGQAAAISNLLAVLGLLDDQPIPESDRTDVNPGDVSAVSGLSTEEEDAQAEQSPDATTSSQHAVLDAPHAGEDVGMPATSNSSDVEKRGTQPLHVHSADDERERQTVHVEEATDNVVPVMATNEEAQQDDHIDAESVSVESHSSFGDNDLRDADQVDDAVRTQEDSAVSSVKPEPASAMGVEDTAYSLTDDVLQSFTGNFSWSAFLERTIHHKIHQRSSFVSMELVNHFLAELHLVDHLESLRKYVFMYAGDLFSLVTTSLFEELKSGRPPNHVRANMLFEATVKATGYDSDPRVKLVSFASRQKSQPSDYSGVDCLDFLEFRYETEWPLSLVITPECMDKYNKIFRYLMQQRRIIFELRSMWSSFQDPSIRQAMHDATSRRLQLFRQELEHFIGIFHSYVMQQLDICWVELKTALNKARRLDEIREAHSKYLSDALSRCLLSESEQPSRVMQIILATFNHILQACRHLYPAGAQACVALPEKDAGWSDSTLTSCIRSFRQSSKFLFNTLRKLSIHSGNSAVEGLLESWNFNNHNFAQS